MLFRYNVEGSDKDFEQAGVMGQFILQAVGDLRRRTLLPGKNLQKIKELQAANKRKEVSERKSFFASIKQHVILKIVLNSKLLPRKHNTSPLFEVLVGTFWMYLTFRSSLNEK